MQYVYGVFLPYSWWVTTSRIEALRFARDNCASARRLPYSYWVDCGRAMDAPTFRVMSDLI